MKIPRGLIAFLIVIGIAAYKFNASMSALGTIGCAILFSAFAIACAVYDSERGWWKVPTVTIQHAGKAFFVLCLGVMASVFGFLVWAMLSHRTR